MSIGFIEVKVELQGIERLAFALNQTIPTSIRRELRTCIDRMAMELQRHVKQDYLTGQALNVRTGTLRRSINIKREDTPTTIKSTVGTNVIYGRAWELGLVPSWAGQHGWRFNVPGPKTRQGTQPARPFLRPAYYDLRAHIVEEIQKTVGRVLQKGIYGSGP